MLSYLLDEQISPAVARQLRAKRPDISILSLYEWRAGALAGSPDSIVLAAASEENLTLVTYDRRTIPPLLVEMGAAGLSHAGVVFVDELTIPPNDFGGLILALAVLWDQYLEDDWINRIDYLQDSR